MGKNMVQYGVWSNCCNDCQFCLRQQRRPYTKEKQLMWLQRIKSNIKLLDWENQFQYGISLLGGQLYFITDKDVQYSFLDLIDIIIEYVLKKSKNKNCKYSTVTNGLYDPVFLYKVIDKISDSVGIQKVDINFSFDLKYRFKSEADKNLCLKNINQFHKRYNYNVCVQMILTQNVINLWKQGLFDVNKFQQQYIPGNRLVFLYPHPIKTGIDLKDFNFNRKDFLQFLQYLKTECDNTYQSFLLSTKNSCTFKYTGLKDRARTDYYEMPRLTDGKQIMSQKCGHSILYKCYADSNKCVLCDLMLFDSGVYI